MMSARSIRIAKNGQEPVCTELMLDAIRLPINEPTCINLLPKADYDSLLEKLPKELLTDRRIQTEAKPLSYYFADRTGNLALRVKYSDPGQFLRGIHALFDNKNTPSIGAHYYLGLTPDLFELMVKRSGNDDGAVRGKGMTTAHSSSLSELLATHSDLKVPESLRKDYRGTGPEVDTVRHLIVLAARNTHPVLIQGESGTGKEVVARQIHQLRFGVDSSLIAVNCGGIPDNLLESELFGHVKGAFSGALRDKDGLWKLAKDGTLFLDEIGDLSLHHQAKLLRVLEDGRFRPVGGDKEIPSNARIIAATNRDLQHLVNKGLFREDLFYRLFTIRICTPALREHPQDIPDLALHFWRKYYGDNPNLAVPTKKILKALTQYQWRGNARELRAFILNVAELAGTSPIDSNLIQAVMKERFGSIATSKPDD